MLRRKSLRWGKSKDDKKGQIAKADLDFLQNIGDLSQQKKDIPKVKIEVAKIRTETNQLVALITIYEQDSSEQFDGVVDMFRKDMSTLRSTLNVERCLFSMIKSLGKDRIWDKINNKEALLNNILTKEKTDAKVTKMIPDDGDNSVRITAFSIAEIRRANKVISESKIVRVTVAIPDDIDLSTKITELEQYASRIEYGTEPIEVHVKESERLFELVGLLNCVMRREPLVKDVLQDFRKEEEDFEILVSNNVWDFLRHHFAQKVKQPIEEELKRSLVTINLTEQQNVFTLRGTKEGLQKCKEKIQELAQVIVEKSERITSLDVQELLASKQGKVQLEYIENTKNVFIKKNQFVDVVSDSFPVDTTVEQPQTRLSKGVKISTKCGRIENEEADVLVNSALLNLDFNTDCGKALKRIGGPAYIEECKQHTNISQGDIVCTVGGALLCKHVVHAVCRNWNNNEVRNSEKFLRRLITKILLKCIELRVSSVAMPMIGSGKHGYPCDLVLEIIRQEVVHMFIDKKDEFSLNDIRVIIFEENDMQENTAKSLEIDSRDTISLHFIGSQQDVIQSIKEVKMFVNKVKGNDLCLTVWPWDQQQEGRHVVLVALQQSSDEYVEILNHFEMNYKKREIEQDVSVKKIERIQNPAEYKLYSAMRESMKGRENEKRLFHGTATQNIPIINANNFTNNHSGTGPYLDGKKVSERRQKYGQGVYFAKKSSYAIQFCRDDQGNSIKLSPGDLQLYVVRVLVGEFTKGKKDMKTPPFRNDPENPEVKYDSTVDDVINPSIFVIFKDHQCYPEYLITLAVVQRQNVSNT